MLHEIPQAGEKLLVLQLFFPLSPSKNGWSSSGLFHTVCIFSQPSKFFRIFAPGIYYFREALCIKINLPGVSIFPGRASSSPTIDVFITLMQMGTAGYKELMEERRENYKTLKEEMIRVAEKYGERVLETKNNPISIGK